MGGHLQISNICFCGFRDSTSNLCYQLNMAQPTKSAAVNVLFVCIGNACRSQMAEALANHIGEGRLRALSAGTSPLGEIAPLTYQVLRDKGLGLEGHWSKGLHDVPVEEMDVVVGMGGEGHFPLASGFKGMRIEWNIPDPYGHDAAYFRSVCDLVERQVKTLLHQIDAHHQTIEVVPPAPDKNKPKGKNRS